MNLQKNKINLCDLHIYFKPQYKFISINDIILVDEIIRFENINNDWKRISEIINSFNNCKISDKLQVMNASPKIKKWQELYTEETKNIVYNLYKKDFELFNYSKNF